MSQTVMRVVWAAAILLVLEGRTSTLLAQQAMTVAGHVTSRGGAVVGAHVGIPSLKIDRVTDAEGRYSFVVPSANVRGQTVKLTASMDERRARLLPKTVNISLAGGAITQDFDLLPAGDFAVARQSDSTGAAGAKGRQAGGAPVDTLLLTEIAGAVSLPSALAGRVPGLDVMTSSVLGGSAVLTYRGSRSLVGANQPLYVVDGLPMDNTTFTSGSQRAGLGGFDYGSPIQDIDPANVASLRWVTGADAVARYGGRAANGVVVISTRTGEGTSAFGILASQQITSESATRLPAFQNSYGQGLDGKFEFFNGKGGGINDNVNQSWGPALNGQPLAQASYTTAGQPDVRLFTAQPNNVSDFFSGGKTLNTQLAIQGGGDIGSYRIFGSNRDTRGVTLNNSLVRREGGIRFTLQPDPRFTLAVSTTISETKNDNAPGTGFNVGNPFSQFTEMARQVSTDSLRVHLRDAAGNPISWSYSGQNNPYFASLLNSNHSLRDQAFGDATVTYALTPELMLTARGGGDSYRDGRLFSIASGWMGGFPFLSGAGDFSKGGSQGDAITVQQSNAMLRLDGSRTTSNKVRWTYGAGLDVQRTSNRTRTAGVDSIADVPSAGAPDTATVPLSVSYSADAKTTGVFGQTGFTFADAGSLQATLRNEWSSIVAGQTATTLYPAVDGNLNLFHLFSGLKDVHFLNSAVLRGDLSRSGSNLTPYEVATLYTGRLPSGTLTPLAGSALVPAANLEPEVTTNAQVGADFSLASRRIDLGFTAYTARTSGVVLPVANATLNTLRAMNAGEISNTGVELEGAIRGGDGEHGFGWELSGNVAKNNNNVEHLNDTVSSIALGPPTWGATIEARTGQPLGVIVGHKYQRDASTGELLLVNGLPIPDTNAGDQVLGNSAPNWIVGSRASFRYGWLSLDLQGDGHIGGSIFSTTKVAGDFSGNLAETAFRPDSGLLITGIDATTKRGNTTHVSTQDYYHALAAIQEPWVYSASYFKLRDARLSLRVPANLWHLPFQGASISLIGRNLFTWSSAHDFDPESVLSPYGFGGIEFGQLPTVKSIGLQFGVTP